MCQALVLGWLDCLFTMCRTKTETLAVARDFIFFTGKSNGSGTFCTSLLYKYFKFSYFFRMELQKFTKLPDYYRLSCFWQILFSMSCSLILMNLWVVSGGIVTRQDRSSRCLPGFPGFVVWFVWSVAFHLCIMCIASCHHAIMSFFS